MVEKKILIAPSILSADFTQINKAIDLIEKADADWIHLDVMDGQFVPEITFGQKMVRDIKKNTSRPLDVHLMVEDSHLSIDDYIKAGATNITVHYESTTHLHRVLTLIKDGGVKAGVSIIPSTSVKLIYPVLDIVDIVLVMSVNPGYGGQSFIESSLEKIAKLKKYRDKNNLNFLIAVDGGINLKTADSVKKAGADVLIAGSAFFFSDNPIEIAQKLRSNEF